MITDYCKAYAFDIVSRYGSEEFMIILSQASPEIGSAALYLAKMRGRYRIVMSEKKSNAVRS